MADDNRRFDEVGRAVLNVYQEENPSARPIDRDPEAFAARERVRLGMFRDDLKFPIRMFQDARLLEFGAGTGEHSVFYSRWGATCTLVEYNPLACARTREIFDAFAPADADVRIIEESLFDVDLEAEFDIVACSGVLNHTADKARGFANLVRHLKPGGYAFLGLATQGGWLQRNLQRLIIYRYADSPAEIETLADRLFGEHLDRATRFGGRTRRALIYDNYVNPKIDTPSVPEVLGWFAENGLRVHATWPSIAPLQMGDTAGSGGMADVLADPAVAAFSELFWMAHALPDREALGDYLGVASEVAGALYPLTGAIGDVTPDGRYDLNALAEGADALSAITARLDPFQTEKASVCALLEEVRLLLDTMKTGGPDEVAEFLARTQYLFRGTNGLGMNHFIGYADS